MFKAIKPRSLKKIYRRHPLPIFIMTVGGVDAVMGGLGQRWTLLGFGLTLALLGLIGTGKQLKRTRKKQAAPRYYLPAAPERITLPPLEK